MTPVSNRELFYEIDPKNRDIDPSNIWLKKDVVWSFNYYCYKNIFVSIESQVRALSVNYFVGDEWERMKIVDSEGIEKVMPLVKKSYDLNKLKYNKN